MKTTKLVAALAAAGLGWVLSAPANAAPTFFSPITTFEDDNLDFFVDTNANGTLDVGERLISVLEWNVTTGILAGQGPNSILPDELTAVSDITVLTKIATGNPGVFDFVFAPSGAAGVLSGFAAGTMAAVFIDGVPDLNVINSTCGTRAQCQSLAGLGLTDGSSVYATVGFFGDPDEFWFANDTSDSIAAIQAAGATQALGAFNFALSIDINHTGRTFAPQPCGLFCNPAVLAGQDDMTTVIGQGSLLGGQGLNATQWTGRSDTDFQVAVIPEPGSLALLGAAFLGAGALARRKSSK